MPEYQSLLQETKAVRDRLINGPFLEPVLPPVVAEPLEREWTEQEAFTFCSRLTKSHYENFPVGSMLIPASIQPAIHSLYAFMRTADDFADENRAPGDEAQRLAYLDTWKTFLADCEKGRARHPIFIALKSTLEKYQLPTEWLRNLLSAFTMDVTVRRYQTFDDVLAYCRYSANPVGRLILSLFGYRDEERFELSDSICSALQLANHWQDVAIDLGKDRIYLPQEDMQRFSVSEAHLRDQKVDDSFRQLLAHQIKKTRVLFAAGESLPKSVRGRLRLELRMTWLGGSAILDKIEQGGYDVFHRRPVVTKVDWLWLGLRALGGR